MVRNLPKLLCVVLVMTALSVACDTGGSSPTSPSDPDDDDSRLIGPPSTNARDSLPSEPRRQSSPQANGVDEPLIEVAGENTVRRLRVANDSRGTLRLRAGEWFEPKDGSNQRMMVTRTTSVPPGEVVVVPTACMQNSKRIPPSGARFFSRTKSSSGRVQQCQVDCLSDSEGTSEQSCIWRCEWPTIDWTVVDNCNDGRQMQFRLFEYRGGQIVDRWPSDRSRSYVANELGTEYFVRTRSALDGEQVCFGGNAGNQYWGVGIDGDRGCETCCYALPDYGIVTGSFRAGC